MIDNKKTVTAIFLVPLTKIRKETLKRLGFVNAYIKDGERDVQYDNAVYMVFKPNNLDEFREFLISEYDRTKNIIEDYDYEGGFVVVVYKIDSSFKNDVELIKKGRYSKTSKKFQQEFPKNILIHANGAVKEEVSLQYRIFNKTGDMVKFWEEKLDVHFTEDQEVWHMFDEEKETLTLIKLLENV